MPNGGSDCCGTCWFNAKNEGEAGYAHVANPKPDHCTIRGLAIHNPFYTYCANHPHRNPRRDEVPIGPVFVGEERELWRRSPDGDDVRSRLLALLTQVSATPSPQYPIGIPAEQVLIWQIGEFREERALADLRRIANFEPGPVAGDPYDRTLDALIREARLAIDKVEGRRPVEFTADRTLAELEDVRGGREAHESPATVAANRREGRTRHWLVLGAVAVVLLAVVLILVAE